MAIEGKSVFMGLTSEKWSRESDSNRRPTHYECVALPTELSRQNSFSSLYIKIMQPTIGEIEKYQVVQIDRLIPASILLVSPNPISLSSQKDTLRPLFANVDRWD